MRRVVGTVLLVVAGLLATGGALLAYALASEYGASPNHDLWTDLRMNLSGLLPLVVLVGGLVWWGLLGTAPHRRTRRRAAVSASAALLTAVASASGVALGQHALEQRCAEEGAAHSAACPGFPGPPVTPAS